MALCRMARTVFLAQPALLELNAPIAICGDVHGQFHDLLRIFEMNGFPGEEVAAGLFDLAVVVGGVLKSVATPLIASLCAFLPPLPLPVFDQKGASGGYLFLGDYVDRAKQSIETICLLLAYKLIYQETFFLLRGNHECATLNRIYGFFDECKRR